jgi:DNA-directed RNA polymerase beta' subunit
MKVSVCALNEISTLILTSKGHIELPVPVFNPVFFSVMYKVGCVNIKLILIELNIHFGNECKMSAVFICTIQPMDKIKATGAAHVIFINWT